MIEVLYVRDVDSDADVLAGLKKLPKLKKIGVQNGDWIGRSQLRSKLDGIVIE